MSLIVHVPRHGQAQQLFLLFHGLGAAPDDLVPLGRALGQRFPNSAIVSVQAPFDCGYSSGYEWFSVLHQGQRINDEQRCERVAQALPSFVSLVQSWQQHFGLSADVTALVGFSQGAMMALASSQLPQFLAARIVGLSGRFAPLPDVAPPQTTIHLIHGKHDDVVPYANTVNAAERLVQLGADVTADVLPFIGHEINQEVLDLLIERLTTHIPKRLWEEGEAASNPDMAPPST